MSSLKKIFAISTVCYLWFTYIGLVRYERVHPKIPGYDGGKISVVVPNYNEDAELLERSIQSIIAADGNKEIIVVDDGSYSPSSRAFLHTAKLKSGIKLHQFEKNHGKRAALYYAISNLVAKDSKYTVFIDSDTVLDRRALVNIVRPLKLDKIGAVTGDVRLLNERVNWLTRMVGAYYWTAINIHRKSHASFGVVDCCSGCLSAYETSHLKSIIKPFYSQTFLDDKATYADDRHLTNLTLQKGLQVFYQFTAVSYTDTPERFKPFLRQQLRWQRGFIQEAIFSLTFLWRKQKILFVEILVVDLILSMLAAGIMIGVIVSIFVNPEFFISAVIPAWLILMFVKNIPLFFFAPAKIPGLIVYTFVGPFVLYWQRLFALVTLTNKSWVTRKGTNTRIQLG